MPTLPDFQLLRPATVQEAVRLCALHPGSRFLGGGTDLLPNLRRGLVTPGAVIDLGTLDDLARIQEEEGVLQLGAGVPLAKLAADPRVQGWFPAVAQAASGVAGPTHRVTATLGGSLCQDTRCRFFNQSEAWRRANEFCLKLGSDTCRVASRSSRCYAAFSGDLAPALMVHRAELELLGPAGSRRLPLSAFYRDDGRAWLALEPAELLVAVRVPLETGWASAYEKIRMRASLDFPLVGVAVALRRQGALLRGLRVALTGVASRPVAIPGLEELEGRPLEAAALALLAAQVGVGTHPMGTTLAEVPYRRRVAPILAKRLVERLWAGATS